MMNLRSSNPKNAANERGAGIVEYVLVVGLIAIASLTAASALASSVSESMTNAANAFGGEGGEAPPVTQEKKVDAGKAGKVHFEIAGDQIRFASISAGDGWTSQITRDNGSRATVRFTNTESGERVVVRGWINKKDKLKTKVIYK